MPARRSASRSSAPSSSQAPWEKYQAQIRTKAICAAGAAGAIGVRCPVRLLRDDGVFPLQPVGRRLAPNISIWCLHQTGVTGGEIAIAVGYRQAGPKTLPRLGEESADAPIEPVDFGPAGHGDPRNDDLRHPFGVALGVGEDQRRPMTLRTAATALSPGAGATAPCRRGGARWCSRPCQWPGRWRAVCCPAPTLVEKDYPVALGIEEAAISRPGAGARPAMDHQRRLALRVGRGFPVDEVVVAHVKLPLVVRLDRRVRLGDVAIPVVNTGCQSEEWARWESNPRPWD